MEHLSLLLVKSKNLFIEHKRLFIYFMWILVNGFILFAIGYYLVNRLTGEMVFQVNSIQIQNTNYISDKGYVSHDLLIDITITNGTNKDLVIPYKEFQIAKGAKTEYPTVLEVTGNPTDSISISRGQKINIRTIYEPFDPTVKSTFVIPAIYNAPTISMDIKSK